MSRHESNAKTYGAFPFDHFKMLRFDALMSTSTKGRIITTAISSLKHVHCDEIWQITRVNSEIKGTLWVPELAPSQALYSKHQHEWKETPPETWWPLYEERFNNELKSSEKLKALRKLWRLIADGKSVALACFCPNHKFCHRSLVGIFLEKQGIEVIEFDTGSIRDNRTPQLDLFEQERTA